MNGMNEPCLSIQLFLTKSVSIFYLLSLLQMRHNLSIMKILVIRECQNLSCEKWCKEMSRNGSYHIWIHLIGGNLTSIDFILPLINLFIERKVKCVTWNHYRLSVTQTVCVKRAIKITRGREMQFCSSFEPNTNNKWQTTKKKRNVYWAKTIKFRYYLINWIRSQQIILEVVLSMYICSNQWHSTM